MSNQESLFTSEANVADKVHGLLAALEAERTEKVQYKEENERLYEIIRQLKRQKFGRTSERWVSDEQLLFNEVEVEAKKAEAADGIEDEVEVKAHKKKRGKRRPLPADLPREVRVIDLPESEKVDTDGNSLTLRVVGKEISEKFEYQPASMKVIEIHRLKYEVVKENGEVGIKTAKPEATIISKGIVTPSLLASLVTSKYADGLPLYRQEEIFARLGIDLSRSSMARWIVQAAKALMPIRNVLEDRLMLSPYVACDETWTQVLKEKGRTAESQSWMWVRATPSDEKKIVLFDYDPHRSGEVAKRLLAEYRGFLQADGYAAYNILEKQEGLIRFGCNMHGRRKFEAARVVGAKQGHGLAETALKFYEKLYDLEKEIRSFSWDERHRVRKGRAVPIWEEFKAWADAHGKKVPPKSKIGEAFHYFLNEYDYLIGYLKDGRLEMDNGFAERMIKYFAIGRNNWLFSDTEAGAEASSLFYGLVVTAKANGINPYEALRKIFEEVPKAKNIEDFERIADLILSPAQAH